MGTWFPFRPALAVSQDVGKNLFRHAARFGFGANAITSGLELGDPQPPDSLLLV